MSSLAGVSSQPNADHRQGRRGPQGDYLWRPRLASLDAPSSWSGHQSSLGDCHPQARTQQRGSRRFWFVAVCWFSWKITDA